MLPRILDHLDNLTNWYIRFNRDRLKGSEGKEETVTALNTLFEALFILIRALAPFAPFITDKIYLNLLPYIPPKLQATDPRCLHFLEFPKIEAKMMNHVIERRVARMQKIIDLTRVSRERRVLGLKVPLKSLVVIHPDQEYLHDIESLKDYITRELNVRDLITTSDESQYGVQWSVSADWAVLGKKLKKDAKRVRDGLSKFTSDDLHGLLPAKSINVAGIDVSTDDLIIKRSLKDADPEKFESNTDGDVLIILDVETNRELRLEHLARELVNRVQRVRKKAGLVATDDVRVEYEVLEHTGDVHLDDVVSTHADSLQKTLRGSLVKADRPESVNGASPEPILEEQQEIQQTIFMLRLFTM